MLCCRLVVSFFVLIFTSGCVLTQKEVGRLETLLKKSRVEREDLGEKYISVSERVSLPFVCSLQLQFYLFPACLSICSPMSLPVCLSTCQPAHPPARLPACLCICFSFCPSFLTVLLSTLLSWSELSDLSRKAVLFTVSNSCCWNKSVG